MERYEIELVSTQDERRLWQNIRKALVCGFFMQIVHKEGKENAYLTVEKNQGVSLHPSCQLETTLLTRCQISGQMVIKACAKA